MSNRSPSPWGSRMAVSASPPSTSASPPTARTPLPPLNDARTDLALDGQVVPEDEEEFTPWSSKDSLHVNSTVPPCQPRVPASTKVAQPISPSILLNPLPTTGRSTSPGSTAANLLKRLPGKRRQSVVVEVHHSPPPAHFFQDPDHRLALERDPDDDDDDVGVTGDADSDRTGRPRDLAALNRFSSDMSPPRPDLSGLRSRSASPIHTPRSGSPNRHHGSVIASSSSSTAPSFATTLSPASGSGSKTEFAPLSSIISNRSTNTTSSQCSSSRGSSNGGTSPNIRFAPLPPGRRACRSNSISLGVASRARMIGAQGGQPNVQQARYAGPLQWYEGGQMPDDVYTWRDAQKGLSKIWKRVSGDKDKGKDKATAGSPSASASTSTAIPSTSALPTATAVRGRTGSLSSATSAGNAEESRRMECEAKSGSNKGEVEHVEEAVVEPDILEEDEDDLEDGGADSVVGEVEEVRRERLAEEDDGEDTASEVTAPRTPPEGTALGLTNVGIDDVELERERRRVAKGKAREAVVEPSTHSAAVSTVRVA